MMVDSDWASDEVGRRSTSDGVAQLGRCTILSCNGTKVSQDLSSVEAEGYAICPRERAMRRTVAREAGLELKQVLHSDSTSTISQHPKVGLGRMKHVELRLLFVKDRLRRQGLTLCKVPETENSGDQGARCKHSLLSVLGHWFGACEAGSGGDQGPLQEHAGLWRWWTAKRVRGPGNAASWAGTMDAGELDVHGSDASVVRHDELIRPRDHARK